MQDFLAGGGKRQGDYTELQVGPAPTQMQNFAVPKGSITEWTEWFKGFDADVNVMRGKDYQAALNVIDNWIRSDDGMPKDEVNKWDAFFQKYATKAPSKIMVRAIKRVYQTLSNHSLLIYLPGPWPTMGCFGRNAFGTSGKNIDIYIYWCMCALFSLHYCCYSVGGRSYFYSS